MQDFLLENISLKESAVYNIMLLASPEDLSLINVLMTSPLKTCLLAGWGRSRAWSKIHARGA